MIAVRKELEEGGGENVGATELRSAAPTVLNRRVRLIAGD
jgi:hypothetical protein